ncbi:MAG: hypothetical protein K2W33_03885 [Burkholderiales bacterium]|nr:hypothetical protein [Burkholderiales bacterium]
MPTQRRRCAPLFKAHGMGDDDALRVPRHVASACADTGAAVAVMARVGLQSLGSMLLRRPAAAAVGDVP